ncbi:lysoplasmalogenase [Montanilutibacter psychrotolerans]|uniref:Lysoplasmalogenase n=1 Tax=Montanilutibacter psychrotolerans TaxID=1327343 RepID=A0A3M8T336_9GAMM|nr:lysoplasmalogenase [Lysobacter psychrotolerans]RNF85172.1 lysoplasmalogenase [Lysobacter psychrotolerans]
MSSQPSLHTIAPARRRWGLAILVVAALAIVGALLPDQRWLHYVCKPLATLLIVAMLLGAAPITVRYRRAVLVGLLLSTLGDALLMLPGGPGKPDLFVFGLGSFLCAHIAYLVAFGGRARAFAVRWPWLAYALLGGSVLSVLWPHLPGPLRPPVVVYVLVLAAMAALAASMWWQHRDRPATQAAVGGLLFVASDATLAFDRFVQPFPAGIVVVLATYWSAQWLIARSATRD